MQLISVNKKEYNLDQTKIKFMLYFESPWWSRQLQRKCECICL